MMDRLLTAGLCGNTIGQEHPNAHSSTSNMAFHLKDVCSSNFTWPLNMSVNLEKCAAIEVFVWKRVAAGQAPVRSLALKISVILGHTDKSSLILFRICKDSTFICVHSE